MNGKDLLAILASYGLGCLAAGYYLVRWRTGLDIRQLGSGSVGAQNVGRVLGQWGFWITMTADALKGAVAILAGRLMEASLSALLISLIAVAAGHIFPIQLQFRGGKGIAVSLGALLALDFKIAAGWLFLFAGLYLCCRHYMFSGMVSVLLIPVIAAILGRPAMMQMTLFLLSGLILFAHRSNIAALLKNRLRSDTDDPSVGRNR